MADSRPVYVPTGNPDTVNAANYAPGEVGTTYVSNRKRYQIAQVDPELKQSKEADMTGLGPIQAGTVAFWSNQVAYQASNAPKAAVVLPKEEEPAPQAPGAAPAGPAKPVAPPKVRDLKQAGVFVGPFATPVAPGNVCHLQQTGLAKVKVPEGTNLPEGTRIGVNRTTGVLASTTEPRDTIGTTVGPVKDGMVLVDLEIASAD